MRQALERLARLDVKIYNAAFAIEGAIDTVAPDQMRKLTEVNYLGTYYAGRATLPVFRRQGRDHLVIVSPIVGKRGVLFMGAYAATKFVQLSLAECLRSECVGADIYARVVLPVLGRGRIPGREVARNRPQGRVRRRAVPKADRVANAIALAIAHPVRPVYSHVLSRGLIWLNALPRASDRLVRK